MATKRFDVADVALRPWQRLPVGKRCVICGDQAIGEVHASDDSDDPSPLRPPMPSCERHRERLYDQVEEEFPNWGGCGLVHYRDSWHTWFILRTRVGRAYWLWRLHREERRIESGRPPIGWQ